MASFNLSSWAVGTMKLSWTDSGTTPTARTISIMIRSARSLSRRISRTPASEPIAWAMSGWRAFTARTSFSAVAKGSETPPPIRRASASARTALICVRALMVISSASLACFRAALDVVWVGRHWLANVLVEQPDVQAGEINLDCFLTIDGDPLAVTNVLPMTAVEPAALAEVATMKDAMELRLRSAAIVETITLADDPLSEPYLLRQQAFIERCKVLAHSVRVAVVAVVDWIAVGVPQDDDLKRPIDDRHLRKLPQERRRCAEA
jgi:hypothetical protein